MLSSTYCARLLGRSPQVLSHSLDACIIQVRALRRGFNGILTAPFLIYIMVARNFCLSGGNVRLEGSLVTILANHYGIFPTGLSLANGSGESTFASNLRCWSERPDFCGRDATEYHDVTLRAGCGCSQFVVRDFVRGNCPGAYQLSAQV